MAEAQVAPVTVPVATLGHIEPFDENLEDISSYIERLDQFFLANVIPDERKAPVFLSLSGRKIYQLLKNLTAPQLPKEKTYKELTEILENHFRPKVNITTERYRFQSRKQGSGESIHDYVSALKQLSINCAFNNDLDDRLRDTFIFGLGNTETKKRLLAKPELNFATAVQQASAIEQANADASEINRDVKPVHAVDRQRPRQRRRRQRPPPQRKIALRRATDAVKQITRHRTVFTRTKHEQTVTRLDTFDLRVDS